MAGRFGIFSALNPSFWFNGPWRLGLPTFSFVHDLFKPHCLVPSKAKETSGIPEGMGRMECLVFYLLRERVCGVHGHTSSHFWWRKPWTGQDQMQLREQVWRKSLGLFPSQCTTHTWPDTYTRRGEFAEICECFVKMVFSARGHTVGMSIQCTCTNYTFYFPELSTLTSLEHDWQSRLLQKPQEWQRKSGQFALWSFRNQDVTAIA